MPQLTGDRPAGRVDRINNPPPRSRMLGFRDVWGIHPAVAAGVDDCPLREDQACAAGGSLLVVLSHRFRWATFFIGEPAAHRRHHYTVAKWDETAGKERLKKLGHGGISQEKR